MYREGLHILSLPNILTLSDTIAPEHHTHRTTYCPKCIHVHTVISDIYTFHYFPKLDYFKLN